MTIVSVDNIYLLFERFKKALVKMLDTLRIFFGDISRRLGIHWAPMNIPVARRCQTLGALMLVVLMFFVELPGIFVFMSLVYSRYWWFAFLYGVWMLNDMETCNRGGRKKGWFCNLACWRYMREYYPVKLAKVAELDPARNYLFACFPHGVLANGPFISFGANAAAFATTFPGMTSHLILLAGHFLFPFTRDILLNLGACSSSEQSLTYLLDARKHKGKCVALMVGGVAEAMCSHHGEYKIVLSNRKGFIRIAMKTGSPLVPVVSFGETDIYRVPKYPEDSWMWHIQEKIRNWFGFAPVFPVGRGIFQYSYGILPLRNPITVVVGKPMEVQKNLEPTASEVDAVHAEFTQRLIDHFETQKQFYVKNHEGVHLVIM